jgi:hypothetical protein
VRTFQPQEAKMDTCDRFVASGLAVIKPRDLHGARARGMGREDAASDRRGQCADFLPCFTLPAPSLRCRLGRHVHIKWLV